MAVKKSLPPPIDRPLSKAYLRKFTGWSTAFPPGMSEPTSLRTMHNCNVAPDSSLRIRPGLRRVVDAPTLDIVGTFEHFYTNSGKKALLFAVREADNTVGFRFCVWNATTKVFDVKALNDATDGFTATGSINFTAGTTYVKYVQIDNKILALSNNGEPFRLLTVGATKTAKTITEITKPTYVEADRLGDVLPSLAWIAGSQTTVPVLRSLVDGDLISSDPAKNIYNFGYFYTFNNEIGESAPSMVWTCKTQRRWTSWQVNATDESKSADQIGLVMPEAVWNAAVASGAVSWNLYFFTWSNQDAVPVEGLLLKTTTMTGKTYQQAGWAAHTPLLQGNSGSMALPAASTRENFTSPSAAGQGLVAGDRLILVYDKNQAARIKWSSNQMGDYLNFSASKGGGYKTLTSGNLYFPATVKLWQNPQSVDTLTVLCSGLDGYGTAYYMSPGSSVSAQNQTITIMGFEETTATPGTVSPYGCEVLNNALYHPLDNNLMKSSAANYNINHLLMADKIQNVWHQISLDDKRRFVSAQMDSTLYYLVRSPLGWDQTSPGNGNQVWMCDTALSGIWSCWDVVGTALHKLEVDGLLYMGIVSGGAIYVFDPEQDHDDVWSDGAWIQQGIPWEIVTNTQGANRAHDAWCLLQQVNVTFGNFTGECVYGIRGKDANGQPIEIKKHYIAPVKGHDPLDRYDLQDFLLVRRPMVEWEFFWRSADRPKNRSYGSVNFVQYRYAPISVNVGYEYGSVESFEYGQRDHTFSNGVPQPFADTTKS